MDTPRLTRVLVTLVASVMVLSALVVVFDTPANHEQTTVNQTMNTISGDSQYSPTVGSVELNGGNILPLLSQYNVPTKYAYLPNFNYLASDATSVSPLYQRSPAPIGVTDYGFSTTSGIETTYAYNTSGFLGSVMSEGFDPFYLMNNDPGTMAFQLNAVLNHVTVQGDSSYVFWIQNVMLYTPALNQVQFVSNIWSFSSPGMEFPDNAILSGSGSVVPGIFYYDVGPTVSVPSTFTAIMYIDSTMNDLNNAVDFKYEITNTESTYTIASSTFDLVTFNSVLPGASIPAPGAKFMVSGKSITPAGFLYDAELVATGPGGGSTTSIYAANGQLKLQYKGSTGSYSNVPASFSFGSNAGETIQGLSAWWTSVQSPIAHLALGPSLLVPLWGSDVTRSGGTNLQGYIDPSNAFFFINVGTNFDSSTAAWAPISPNGSYVYAMPGGLDYSGAVMMSEFTPYVFDSTVFEEEETNTTEGGGPPGDVGGGGGGENETAAYFNITLTFDQSKGIYTPLYATGDSQVKNLTLGSTEFNGTLSAKNITPNMYTGTGTSSDPYMIENNQISQLDKLFARTNGFMFPEFSGILIRDTSVYAQINHPASYAIQYPSYMMGLLGDYGLPSYNNLNMMFYNTTNIAVYGGSYVTGWFSQNLGGYAAASIVFWNSYNFLIAGNTFKTMSNAILIYNKDGGSAGGTIWGNHFLNDLISRSSFATGILNGSEPVGILMFSSGNLIYNNYFALDKSVYSPGFDMIAGSTQSYSNDWNLDQKYPVTHSNIVLGYNLTGSIVEVSYQGGNYWSNFDGVIPYSESGNIASGGDLYPLIVTTYAVEFMNVGLPPGLQWSVTLDDTTLTSTGSSITFHVMNGTHIFMVDKPQNYIASPSYGTALVYGENIVKNITFALIQYELTFTQTGSPAGQTWSVNLGGQVQTSTGNNISFMMENGTYSYLISGPQYYKPSPESGTALVNGENSAINVKFEYSHHSITFMTTGLPTGSSWEISLNGQAHSSNSESMVLMRENGTYTYSVLAPAGYQGTPSSGIILLYGNDAVVNIAFDLLQYNVVFEVRGLPSGMDWGVTFNGQAINSTESTITFTAVNGNYSYNVSNVPGYTTVASDEYVVISDHGVTVEVQYAKNPNHLLTAGLMGGGAAAGIGAGILIAYMFWRKPS